MQSEFPIPRMVLLLYALLLVAAGLVYTAFQNPEIFKLHKETLWVITETYNLVVLLAVPMFFGTIGAVSRILLSGLNVLENAKLILSSGLIATFSWMSIKSKIFLSLITPYVIEARPDAATSVNEAMKSSGSEIYSMALIAVLVGMFASNIYIFINQRVEQMVSKAGNK